MAAPTKYGQILRKLLFESNTNESELSEKTGVSKSNISRLENDEKCNPTLNTLIPIARYFGITVSQLIGEECGCKSSRQGVKPVIPDYDLFVLLMEKYMELKKKL